MEVYDTGSHAVEVWLFIIRALKYYYHMAAYSSKAASCEMHTPLEIRRGSSPSRKGNLLCQNQNLFIAHRRQTIDTHLKMEKNIQCKNCGGYKTFRLNKFYSDRLSRFLLLPFYFSGLNPSTIMTCINWHEQRNVAATRL